MKGTLSWYIMDGVGGSIEDNYQIFLRHCRCIALDGVWEWLGSNGILMIRDVTML